MRSRGCCRDRPDVQGVRAVEGGRDGRREGHADAGLQVAGLSKVREGMTCWLAGLPGAGACDGRTVRVHLIPRQLLKRELSRADALRAIEDPRSWVPGCGGPTGIGGHHGQLDYARTLRVPRGRLPAEVELLAAELGLTWWLDREYGLGVVAA